AQPTAHPCMEDPNHSEHEARHDHRAPDLRERGKVRLNHPHEEREEPHGYEDLEDGRDRGSTSEARGDTGRRRRRCGERRRYPWEAASDRRAAGVCVRKGSRTVVSAITSSIFSPSARARPAMVREDTRGGAPARSRREIAKLVNPARFANSD